MNDWYRALDDRIARDVIPPEYANKVSRVLCHDCGDKTEVPFHFVYHKCATCGGYNTRVLEQFDRSPPFTSPTPTTAVPLLGDPTQERQQLEEATTT